jgi:hypothetical protein
MRRRSGRKNPSTATWLVIGGGVVLAGVGVYYLTKKPATPNASDTAAATAALPPTAGNASGPSAGGSTIVYTDATGKTFTRDYAAQIACQLRRIGHPTEAQAWADRVTAAGGTLPC